MSAAQRDVAAFVNDLIATRIPPMHMLGIRVQSLDAREVVGVAPIEGNGNHLGSMYAGTLFGLAEMLGGALFFANFDASRFAPTVKSLTIDFRRPAMTDITAHASMSAELAAGLADTADREGKAEYVIEAELTDAAGTVVAVSTGTYQLRSSAPRD